MKYGVHAGESVESIVSRKQDEISKAGYALWGYGGNFCHPLTQVQPFAEEIHKRGEKLYLAMSLTESKLNNPAHKSSLFSVNGTDWKSIDDHISVLGSKFALCITNLTVCNFDIELEEYLVGVGNKKGQNLGEYIRYRVDKACAVHNENITDSRGKKVKITLLAEVVTPFAVFTKN